MNAILCKGLAILALAACMLGAGCGSGGQEIINTPDLDVTSSARLGGQDAPGDLEGVSSASFDG
jgi:hypothetical protein